MENNNQTQVNEDSIELGIHIENDNNYNLGMIYNNQFLLCQEVIDDSS